jgi:polyphosphate kinase 2 (PPK2 family)
MGKLKRKDYEKRLAPMREELIEMAHWVAETKRRVVVIFEGRDTAGKGGARRGRICGLHQGARPTLLKPIADFGDA